MCVMVDGDGFFVNVGSGMELVFVFFIIKVIWRDLLFFNCMIADLFRRLLWE